jgi:hypothetical protein
MFSLKGMTNFVRFTFSVGDIAKSPPIARYIGSKPHPAPRGFLSRVGPTSSNSHWLLSIPGVDYK